MIRLIDSHAHLAFPQLAGSIEEVMQRAETAGVTQIVSLSTTPRDLIPTIELARRFPGRIYATAGFHPHEAAQITDDNLGTIAEYLKDEQVVALGEIGLDYHYDFSPRDVQQSVFRTQLDMGRGLDLPVVIHSRESVDDTVAILNEMGYRDRRVVFHCFTGTTKEAELIAKHGWRISFTGVVTFKKSMWLQAIARDYPASQLMLETDSPYISPVPVRHKKPNEPAYVAHTAAFLAQLRGVSLEELAKQTTSNTAAFFNL